jgi:hypothetical protein
MPLRADPPPVRPMSPPARPMPPRGNGNRLTSPWHVADHPIFPISLSRDTLLPSRT